MAEELTIQERIDSLYYSLGHFYFNSKPNISLVSAHDHVDIIKAHIKEQNITITGLESYRTEAIARIKELEEQLQTHIDLRTNNPGQRER